MRRYIYIILVVVLVANSSSMAQELLTKEAAVEIALSNNYGIEIARNNLEMAENNSKIENTGFLPSLSAGGSGTYNPDNNSETTAFEDDFSYNGNLTLRYTIFDGNGRKYNQKWLKESRDQSAIQLRSTMETTLLNLFNSYYQIAQLSENLSTLSTTLEISKKRRQRGQYNFDYGRGTKLDVLNAEVDLNRDSVNLINTIQTLANAKRNLNVILGRDVDTEFTVDTDVLFVDGLDYQALYDFTMRNNADLIQFEKGINMSELNVKINQAATRPNIGVSAGYNYQRSIFGAIGAFVIQGYSAGVNLNWNIFDGGRTKTLVKNAKVQVDNQKLQKNQLEDQLRRDLRNSWETYQNNLFVLKVEQQNLETNEINFQRTEEQFKLGQVTSLEFRQAQLNLLNASLSFNQARYNSKNAELQLLALSGNLLDEL